MRADNGDLPRLAAVPVALLLLIALMTACGSSQSGSSASAHLETPTSQTSATPIVTADPGDPTLLPVPADVAFLQAPIAVQNEWRTYYATGAITVVPNSTVPYTRPATPAVVDATNGAVSSTTAQLWGDAVMRENAWENWAITADQTGLFDNGVISAPEAEPGLVLPQGATSFRIVGQRWPASLRLYICARVPSRHRRLRPHPGIQSSLVSRRGVRQRYDPAADRSECQCWATLRGHRQARAAGELRRGVVCERILCLR